MITFPNAKINIGLNIERRRSDGYHDLSTVFYPIPWKDILEIVPAEGSVTTLTVTGNGVECPMEKNLVVKAYRALDAVTPLPPVDIYLHKIIPDGAGLGGGSADAAFTLRMLNEMFALGMSQGQLAEIAARIGADCPFFIYNVPCLAYGIGEKLTPVDLNLDGHMIAVVKPRTSISTKEAFSRVVPKVPLYALPDYITRPVHEWNGYIKNDFEASVFPAHPEISEIKDCLLTMGAAYAAMSGSGTAVYGIFTEKNDTLADILTARFPDYDIMVKEMRL